MRKAWKYVGIAALVAVLSLGAVATVALAQGATGETNSVWSYYERFRSTLAGLLGITVEEYDSAVVQARDQTLSEGVAEGYLTQEQADALKERLEGDPDGLPGGIGRGGHGRGTGSTSSRLLTAAAEKLGMTEDALRTALQEGQTIAALAADKGVDTQTIVDAYIAKVQEGLAQSVADGKLTQEEADARLEESRTQALERISATWDGFARGPDGGGRGGRPHWEDPDGGTDTDTGTDL